MRFRPDPPPPARSPPGASPSPVPFLLEVQREALRNAPGPLWIHGEAGSGVSTLAAWLAEARGGALLDDAERQDASALAAWLETHPDGVLASHLGPEAPSAAPVAQHCLAFRLPSLEEAPGSIPELLRSMAEAAGCPAPLPPELGRLPCPGNLRGLHNRLVRWQVLGQLPEEPESTGRLPLEAEDLATNLHALERILLHRALRRSYGNRVEAARRLGVSRRQLYLLIARHGDPVRGEAPSAEGPKRLARARKRQNSSPLDPAR